MCPAVTPFEVKWRMPLVEVGFYAALAAEKGGVKNVGRPLDPDKIKAALAAAKQVMADGRS